jgi:hypothetical protein
MLLLCVKLNLKWRQPSQKESESRPSNIVLDPIHQCFYAEAFILSSWSLFVNTSGSWLEVAIPEVIQLTTELH